LETSADVCNVLPDAVIEWPILGAQHSNAGDLFWHLRVDG
jgi:hypothetical protein